MRIPVFIEFPSMTAAAEALGVTKEAIRQRVARGRIPAARPEGESRGKDPAPAGELEKDADGLVRTKARVLAPLLARVQAYREKMSRRGEAVPQETLLGQLIDRGFRATLEDEKAARKAAREDGDHG